MRRNLHRDFVLPAIPYIHLVTSGCNAQPFWPLEVVNSLLVAVLQKTISPAQLEAFLRDLKDLPVEVDMEGIDRVYSSII